MLIFILLIPAFMLMFDGFVLWVAKLQYAALPPEPEPDLAPRVTDGKDADLKEWLIDRCIAVIRDEQKASMTSLRHRLNLGYITATRCMDELERRGIVGPPKSTGPRDILLNLNGSGATTVFTQTAPQPLDQI